MLLFGVSVVLFGDTWPVASTGTRRAGGFAAMGARDPTRQRNLAGESLSARHGGNCVGRTHGAGRSNGDLAASRRSYHRGAGHRWVERRGIFRRRGMVLVARSYHPATLRECRMLADGVTWIDAHRAAWLALGNTNGAL